MGQMPPTGAPRRWTRWLWIIAIAGAILWAVAAHAETLTCSTWQGIKTCQGPDGYKSTESVRQGITTGSDNQGNRSSSTTWHGRETTIIRRNGQ